MHFYLHKKGMLIINLFNTGLIIIQWNNCRTASHLQIIILIRETVCVIKNKVSKMKSKWQNQPLFKLRKSIKKNHKVNKKN